MIHGTKFKNRAHLFLRQVGSTIMKRDDNALNREQPQPDGSKDANATGLTGRMTTFVDQFMEEYDERGWKATDVVSSDDVNLFRRINGS